MFCCAVYVLSVHNTSTSKTDRQTDRQTDRPTVAMHNIMWNGQWYSTRVRQCTRVGLESLFWGLRLGLGLEPTGFGLGLGLEPTGFGLEPTGLKLGLGLEPTGFGLGLEPTGFGLEPTGFGLGLEPTGFGLGLGLEPTGLGLDYITGNSLWDVQKLTQRQQRNASSAKLVSPATWRTGPSVQHRRDHNRRCTDSDYLHPNVQSRPTHQISTCVAASLLIQQ